MNTAQLWEPGTCITKILKVYVGHSSSFVKDSKDLTDKLQSIKLQDNEELVSFDVSALFTSIPVNSSFRCNQPVNHTTPN